MPRRSIAVHHHEEQTIAPRCNAIAAIPAAVSRRQRCARATGGDRCRRCGGRGLLRLCRGLALASSPQSGAVRRQVRDVERHSSRLPAQPCQRCLRHRQFREQRSGHASVQGRRVRARPRARRRPFLAVRRPSLHAGRTQGRPRLGAELPAARQRRVADGDDQHSRFRRQRIPGLSTSSCSPRTPTRQPASRTRRKWRPSPPPIRNSRRL